MASDFTQSSQQFLDALDTEIERLQQMRQQIAAVLGAATQPAPAGKAPRKGMSDEGRRRVAEAQRARWAKLKTGSKTPAKGSSKKAAAAPKPSAKKSSPQKAAGKKSATKRAAAESAPAA